MQKKVVSFPVPKRLSFSRMACQVVSREWVAQLVLKYTIAGLFSLGSKSKDPALNAQLQNYSDQIRRDRDALNAAVSELRSNAYYPVLVAKLSEVADYLSALSVPSPKIAKSDWLLQLQCFQAQLKAVPKSQLYQSLANDSRFSVQTIETIFSIGFWTMPAVKESIPHRPVAILYNIQTVCDQDSSLSSEVQTELQALAATLGEYSQQVLALNSLVIPHSRFVTLLVVNGCLDFAATFLVLSHSTCRQVTPAVAQKRLHLATAVTGVLAPWIAAGVDFALGSGYGVVPAYPSYDRVEEASLELSTYQEICFQKANRGLVQELSGFPEFNPFPVADMMNGTVYVKQRVIPFLQVQPPCKNMRLNTTLPEPQAVERPSKTAAIASRLQKVYPNANIKVAAVHSVAQGGAMLVAGALFWYVMPVAAPTLMAIQLAHNVTGQSSTGPMALATRGARSVWARVSRASVLPVVQRESNLMETSV